MMILFEVFLFLYLTSLLLPVILVARNKDSVAGGNTSITVEHNPAYRISAALTYTAQLVNVVAFYLDVRLPYKMLYRYAATCPAYCKFFTI